MIKKILDYIDEDTAPGIALVIITLIGCIGLCLVYGIGAF